MLCSSFRACTGFALNADEAAGALYHAPFPILSHNRSDDPILTYGNLKAQALWGMTWEELTQLPSRLTAEPTHRDQRAAMFEEMRRTGCIQNYEGIRISKTGRRFQIKDATIWTLTDTDGQIVGEAATFKEYTFL